MGESMTMKMSPSWTSAWEEKVSPARPLRAVGSFFGAFYLDLGVALPLNKSFRKSKPVMMRLASSCQSQSIP